MKLGHWLNSLSFTDHLILFGLFFIGIYFSKLTLEILRELYRRKTNDSPYMVKYRITPIPLLSLGLIYTVIIVKTLSTFFGVLD
ncbi:MAG: hypothetical protein CMG74_08930 [Candidatus Marinimicrobia bacterium]|nr:hypothetical protein [Candidatus Neomarinimicrobiota bacterium]